MCLSVCVASCHACECNTGRAGGGLRGGQAGRQAGRAGLGLIVFVLAGINAGRKPGNEVRLWFSLLSSPLLSFLRLLPSPPSVYLSGTRISAPAASPASSGMLLSASIVWAIAAVGSLSSLCAVWTER